MEKSKEKLSYAIDNNAADIESFIGKVGSKVNKMSKNFGDNVNRLKNDTPETI